MISENMRTTEFNVSVEQLKQHMLPHLESFIRASGLFGPKDTILDVKFDGTILQASEGVVPIVVQHTNEEQEVKVFKLS